MQLIKFVTLSSLISLCLFCNCCVVRAYSYNDSTIVSSEGGQLIIDHSPITDKDNLPQKNSGIEVGPDLASIIILIIFAAFVGLRLKLLN